MEEYVLICEDSIDGILTGIYEAYQFKKDEGIPNHDCIHLAVREPSIQRLFTHYRTIETDRSKSEKVIRTLLRELGEDTYYMLCLAMAAHAEGKADAVYHTVVIGLYFHDKKVLDRLTQPAVYQTFSFWRQSSKELGRMLEFLRFSELENGILYAKIGPRNNVLSFVMPHFADRLPADNFVIYDDTRGLFGLHPQYKQWYLVSGQSLDEDNLIFSEEESAYRDLFTRFCEKIAITERTNKKLQMNMLPLCYRKYMVEFNKK